MKYLDAKQNRSAASSDKMLSGPRADKRAGADAGTSTVRPEIQLLADELAVDLSTVTGTGKHGSITKADVHRAAAQES